MPAKPLTTAALCAVAIILAGAPATVLIGRDTDGVSWTPALVATAVAVVGYAACHLLRQSASRRFLADAVATGRFSGSPVFVYTLVAWLLVVAAGGIVMGTYFAGRPAEDGSYRDGLADYPLPVLFLFAGLMAVAGAGYSAREYRRRHELPELTRLGIAREPQRVLRLPLRDAVRQRTRFWLQGALIDGLLFASGVLPVLLSGATPSDDEVARGVLGVVGGPGIVSFALLVVMLLAWPTRRSAFDALRQPSSLAAIALTAVGMTLGSSAAGGVLALAGVLLASATCLNIMDRGSQPWLGFIFYAGNYVLGYLTAPDGNSALPSGVVGWAIALAAAGYAIREAHAHAKRWPALEPLREPVG
ncbi:hypothetical protein [Actinophytocola glycyrrhizae]|uniref:Uncharacterized protein n=1 Tax=Actinophytocola glycyrrhizae TaxID=2044873 RepID=A0ABV9S386_9PSEU